MSFLRGVVKSGALILTFEYGSCANTSLHEELTLLVTLTRLQGIHLQQSHPVQSYSNVSYPKCNSGGVQEVDGKKPPSRL